MYLNFFDLISYYDNIVLFIQSPWSVLKEKVPLIFFFKMIISTSKLEKNPFIVCGFILLFPMSSIAFLCNKQLLRIWIAHGISSVKIQVQSQAQVKNEHRCGSHLLCNLLPSANQHVS